jgi:hypothetical protein
MRFIKRHRNSDPNVQRGVGEHDHLPTVICKEDGNPLVEFTRMNNSMDLFFDTEDKKLIKKLTDMGYEVEAIEKAKELENTEEASE